MSSKKSKAPSAPVVDVNRQSFQYFVGEGPIRRNAKYEKLKNLAVDYEGMKTVYDLFKYAPNHNLPHFLDKTAKISIISWGKEICFEKLVDWQYK